MRRLLGTNAATPAGWVYALLAGGTFVLLNLQTITITGHYIEEPGGPTPKPYHAALLALGLLLLRRGTLVRWRPELTLYAAVTALTSAAAYVFYGPQTFLVNVLIAFYAAAVGATLGLLGGHARIVQALRIGSAFILFAVCVKAVMFRDVFIAFMAAPDGHPLVPFFMGGGPNLEATWVAMGACFFLGSAWLLPYVGAALVIATLYASRIATLLLLLVLMVALARVLFAPGANVGRRVMLAIAAVIAVGIVGAGVAVAAGDGATYLTERFTSIGDDKGSQGRLRLWEGAGEVFTHNPLGVGQGNAIAAVSRAVGEPLPEDNLHNQYLQHLVETGVQGLFALLLLAGATWRRAVVARGRDPLVIYCALYFVASLVQFRGGDALLWFVYGLEMGYAAPFAARVRPAPAAEPIAGMVAHA